MSIPSEKDLVSLMIDLYCKAHHPQGDEPCLHCAELRDYAHYRLSKCSFGDSKPTCSRCTIHCYIPEKRRQIRQVMRYSGPRIILYRPLALMKYILRKYK